MASLKVARSYVPILHRTQALTTRWVSSTSIPPQARTQNEIINRRLQDLEDDIEGNPFTNILCSALRRDSISIKVVPRGMMLQLKSVYLPEEEAEAEGAEETSTPQNIDEMEIDLLAVRRSTKYARPQNEVMLPANLLHPSIQPEKPGRSLYVTLSKSALDDLVVPGKVDILRRFTKTSSIPKRLSELVALQLRERVVQEAEILARDGGGAVVPREDDMECFVLCLDSTVYGHLLAQGVHQRLLFDVQELFPDEQQREKITSTMRNLQPVQECTQTTSARLGMPSADQILCTPFIKTFAPLNVALWRTRCFFGHPTTDADEQTE